MKLDGCHSVPARRCPPCLTLLRWTHHESHLQRSYQAPNPHGRPLQWPWDGHHRPRWRVVFDEVRDVTGHVHVPPRLGGRCSRLQRDQHDEWDSGNCSMPAVYRQPSRPTALETDLEWDGRITRPTHSRDGRPSRPISHETDTTVRLRDRHHSRQTLNETDVSRDRQPMNGWPMRPTAASSEKLSETTQRPISRYRRLSFLWILFSFTISMPYPYTTFTIYTCYLFYFSNVGTSFNSYYVTFRK